MSDVRDPDRDQVAPVHNDQPSCHDLVIEDMKERKEFGLRKYKTELQPFNGRSFLLDAYEEILDLAVYLRGRIEEERQAEEAANPPIFTSEDGQTALFPEWEGETCKCVDPVPALTGYHFYVCMKCIGQVPDEKLVHKQ